MDKPRKSKKRKWIIILIIVAVIVLIRTYLNSPYTHVEERKIINYALQGRDFKLNGIDLNKEKKIIWYTVLKKYKGDWNKIVEVRYRINNYLEKNPDYFLNSDYEIVLQWIGNKSGGPTILQFTNGYPTNYSGRYFEQIIQYEALDCVVVPRSFSFKDIRDFTLYEDIKGLVLKKNAYIDDIEILKNFKSLEFFRPNSSVTDEDLEKFKIMFPDCVIR